MEIFNVGVLEFVFILLLAFLVLGPKKAISTAGDVGRWIKKLVSSKFWRDLVSTSQQIRELPQKMMDEAEIQKTIKDLEHSRDEIDHALKKTIPKLEDDLGKIENSIGRPPHPQVELSENQSEESKDDPDNL